MNIHQSNHRIELFIDPEFVTICTEILAESRSIEQWNEIESDDLFQTEHFAGGFDATEQTFCFSYYDEQSAEYWFQLTMDDVKAIVEGAPVNIIMRPVGQY